MLWWQEGLKEETWGPPVGCQYLRGSEVAPLLMRKDSGALYMTQMGLLSGASRVQVLAGQADKLATPPT